MIVVEMMDIEHRRKVQREWSKNPMKFAEKIGERLHQSSWISILKRCGISWCMPTDIVDLFFLLLESSYFRGKMVGFGYYVQEVYAASERYHFEPMGSVRMKWSNAVLQFVWTEEEALPEQAENVCRGTCNNNRWSPCF